MMLPLGKKCRAASLYEIVMGTLLYKFTRKGEMCEKEIVQSCLEAEDSSGSSWHFSVKFK